MTYLLPSQVSNQSGGLENALVYVSGQVPSLFPGVLLFCFIVIMTAGFALNHRRNSDARLSIWATISAIITSTGGFFLFLYPGIVNLETLVVCVSVTLASALWLFLDLRD